VRQNRQAGQQRHDRAAPVAHQRQRHSHDRQQSRHHAGVDQHVDEEGQGDAAAEQPRDAALGLDAGDEGEGQPCRPGVRSVEPRLAALAVRVVLDPDPGEDTERHEDGHDEEVLDEIRGIHAGGGFGSIIGRNVFQRKRPQALELLATIMDIYAGKAATLRASA